MSDSNWKNYVRGLIRAEISRRNLSYIEISERLKNIGITETPQNISNKIGRGTFSAIFMIQILKVIECYDLALEK
ncbi:DUF6471 domain-containing protein [Shewanella algae]